MEEHSLQQSDIEKTIRGYLPQIIHMSLATCADNNPWVCEVHFAVDDELNIYFSSSMESRHATELRQNPNVAGTIVTQHHMDQKVRGVTFEGTAEQLENIDESHPGFVAYTSRYEQHLPGAVKAARSEGKGRIYKITVKNFYLIDGYESVPQRKYQLPWKDAAE